MRYFGFLVATTLVGTICSVVTFDAARQATPLPYDVRPLESLGGTSSRGNGINDAGFVSGFSNLASGARRAVLWSHERTIQVEPFGGTNSSIAWSGKSNGRFMAGIAQTEELQTRLDGWSCRQFFPVDAAKYKCVGFVWVDGWTVRLPALGGDNSFATAVNNQRQAVGWAETATADSSCINKTDRGFLAVRWDLNKGLTIPLAPYGDDTASAATAISDFGHVVGISGDCDQSVGRHSARYAVMWVEGAVRDLGNLGNDTWNTPTAITRRGDIVVGFANAPGASAENPSLRAWLWTERDDIACAKLPGTDICNLGTLDDNGTAEAWGVNEHGQVVGTACSPEGVCRAFLWENGRMQDLNERRGAYPHHLLNAMDINNRGDVTGRARTSSGFEAFVASPPREH